jgi:transcriptional regulator with PAS, ATPase and Fis domain
LYRINTIELHIPPLRERDGDIELLANHFLERFAKKYKKDIRGISSSAMRKLNTYNWPGNVRELQHALERAVILSSGYTLSSDDFLLKPTSRKSNQENLNLKEIEQVAIEKALRQSDGNLSQAADLLGISRFSLYRKIEKMQSETDE